MKVFRVALFWELESRDWWWHATVADRMVFLLLLRHSCENNHGKDAGCVWASPVGLATYIGRDVTSDTVKEAFARLLAAGALEDANDATTRWRYRIVGFEKLAAAADTARARAREGYRKLREKRAATA